MMSKTAVQKKDRLPFQFEGAATSFGGGLGLPKPKPSYVPVEDTVCLELIRHEDGSIVSISMITEVIVSKCSSLML